MSNKKIVCLGGGSLYFARVLADLAMAPGLAGSEITLFDRDNEKAEIMARTGRRLAQEAGNDLRLRACSDRDDALDGADFAISSIGGGGAGVATTIYGSPYHQADIRIPARYGIYQIVGDTGGPAAMMMAFRTIPIYLDIARSMERRCPHAIFINHSNPMAPLCRALQKHSGLKGTIGICHGVQIGINRIADILELPANELETIWIGTNHYYWFTRIRHEGRDVYPDLWRRLAEREAPAGQVLAHKLSEIYGYRIVYPADDHIVEFYPFLARVRHQHELPYGLEPWLDLSDLDQKPAPPVTAEDTREQRRAYLDDFQQSLDKTRVQEQRTSSLTGEGLGRLIEAIARGKRVVHIVNVPNEGAIPNLPTHAVVEVEGVTDSGGVRPIHVGEAPLALAGLLQKRIAWQELVVDAATTGDRRLALQALMLDEMAILPEDSERMLDELLTASRPMLPRFFR